MSAKIAKSTNLILTEKFNKELDKFFEWAAMSEYLIKDIENEQHEWSIKLLSKFEEPSRNKLEAYIKALFVKYTILIGETEIEDAKLLAKEFKNKSNKKEVKEKVKKEEIKEEVKEKIEEKAEEEIEEESVKLDMSLDTSECFYVDTLEFWTSELVEVFGNPKKTGSKDEEHTWEWKIEVNGEPFSIYNWNADGDSYDESTWYLGSTSENKTNIITLIKYIESWFEIESDTENFEKTNKQNIVESKIEKIEEMEEKINMEELFGIDSDEELELDLNDIEDIEDDE